MPLTLVEGPAGSGKSQLVREMLAEGEADVVADYTAIWAALKGVERGPDGRYPVRTAEDPIVFSGLPSYVRRTVVRQGLRSGLSVVVTSGTPNQAEFYQAIADELGEDFQVQTVDPGRETVIRRLTLGVEIDPECLTAVARWYGE